MRGKLTMTALAPLPLLEICAKGITDSLEIVSETNLETLIRYIGRV